MPEIGKSEFSTCQNAQKQFLLFDFLAIYLEKMQFIFPQMQGPGKKDAFGMVDMMYIENKKS